jgi:5'-phosphate synthase pdxT subunit
VTVGVLALQGDVREHTAAFESLGRPVRHVRTPGDLDGLAGLVLPGGESTTLSILLGLAGLLGPVGEALAGGLPVLGTCAGMILLATEVLDGRPDQQGFDRVDLAVRRNGYGRQVASFECDLAVPALDDPPLRAVFIRAPVVERTGPAVEVLASLDGTDGVARPVLCRQGSALVASFHPELTDDRRLHRYFVGMMDEERQ